MGNKEKTRIVGRKILDILDYIFRLVILNLLIVIPSFISVLIYSYFNKEMNPSDLVLYLTLIPALLYFFPSIVASVDVLRMYENNETKGIIKEFFQSLKKHYWKSLVVSCFLFVLIGVLTFQIGLSSGNTLYGPLLYFYHNLSLNIINLVGLLFTVMILFILLLIMIHIILVMVYFDGLSIWQYLKLASIMAFKNLPITILISIIIGGFVALDIVYYFVMLLGGIILPLYLLVRLTFKQYIKIYRKVGEKDEKNF